MKTTVLLLALSPLGLLLAQPPGGPRPNMMRLHPVLAALDADHDGAISPSELAAASTVLKSLDKNGDGQLTREEMMPRMGEGREGRGPGGPGGGGAPDMVATLMAFDKDGDGRLTKDELPERMKGMVDRGDTNRDGFLSKEEIQAMAGGPGGGPRGEEREGERRGPGGGPGRRMDAVMTALDSDHDGVISAAEIANAAVSLKVLDKNGDGRITEDEVRPAGGPGGFGGDPAQMVDRMMEQLDKNGDGKLSKDELPEPMREGMDMADSNKDGFLSRPSYYR